MVLGCEVLCFFCLSDPFSADTMIAWLPHKPCQHIPQALLWVEEIVHPICCKYCVYGIHGGARVPPSIALSSKIDSFKPFILNTYPNS